MNVNMYLCLIRCVFKARRSQIIGGIRTTLVVLDADIQMGGNNSLLSRTHPFNAKSSRINRYPFK